MTTTIAIIVGSTRPNRLGLSIAHWIASVGRDVADCGIEVVDLRDWPLPMDDEPGIPAHDGYVHGHTRAWSRKIDSTDGFVFVTPQYNWGYPAPLKNAIDHLYREWRGKPAAIVTYGGHGGGKCAAQLRQVLDGLKMRTAGQPVALTLPGEVIAANDGVIDPGRAFASAIDAIRSLIVALSHAALSHAALSDVAGRAPGNASEG